MLGRRFDVNKSLTSLYRKLAGDLEWSDGPKGDIATDSYLESWKAMHNQKIADAFFRCVNDDFMINGIDLPDDSGSPLVTPPFSTALIRRNYAAMGTVAGGMPPTAVLGRSLL